MSHCVNAKTAHTSVKEVNKMRLSLHVGPTSCYYKSHHVNWLLIDFYLVWHSHGTAYKLRLSLSLLKSPALVNDYWVLIDTTVTDGSKHFLALLE